MTDKTRKIIYSAVLGSLYAVLTMALAPISYGPLQFRLSEALMILPFFAPFTAWGLFFGCIIANISSAAGLLDIIFGSLATLLAGLAMAQIGRKDRDSTSKKVVACLMPVLFNGIIVGATLTIALAGLNPVKNFGAFAVYALQVMAGELGVMLLLGFPLMMYLPKQKFFRDFMLGFD